MASFEVHALPEATGFDPLFSGALTYRDDPERGRGVKLDVSCRGEPRRMKRLDSEGS
jgi:hypothetical protein